MASETPPEPAVVADPPARCASVPDSDKPYPCCGGAENQCQRAPANDRRPHCGSSSSSDCATVGRSSRAKSEHKWVCCSSGPFAVAEFRPSDLLPARLSDYRIRA